MSCVVSYRQLVKEVQAGSFSPVYLLHGAEEGIINRAVRRIRDAALADCDDAIADLNYIELEGKGLKPDALSDAVQSMPMFAPRKVVRVIEPPLFTAKKGEDEGTLRTQLLEIIAQSPQETILILQCSSVNKGHKAYKLAAKIGGVYDFPPLTRAEAPALVLSEAKAMGVEMDRNAVTELLGLLGVDGRIPVSRIISSEVQKLAAYVGFNGTVKAEDVRLMVARSSEAKLWDLTDAISEGNIGKALACLHQLWQDGNEPLMILASISRHMASLLVARQGLNGGMHPDEVAPLLGLAPFPASKCVRVAEGFTHVQLMGALQSCIELDYAIKSGKRSAVLGMELLTSNLCAMRSIGS